MRAVFTIAEREFRGLITAPLGYVVMSFFLFVTGFFFYAPLASNVGSIRFLISNTTVWLVFLLPALTIEGLSRGDALHPLQQKFLEHAALQCGICTPGFLVAAKALLDANPDPGEAETRYWLAGNLCRCTGYDKIIRAVLDAASDMKGSAV